MKTLVAVDGSEASFSALTCACRIAQKTRHYVTAMYVNKGEEYSPEETGWPSLNDRIRKELEVGGETALRRAIAVGKELGVAVEGIMANGLPGEEIVSYVASRGIVKLIALGHSSKGRGTQGFVESTARVVIAGVRGTPVLVTSSPREIARILVATDDSESAMQAAAAAGRLAQALGARLRVICSFPDDETILGGYRKISEVPNVEQYLLETQELLREKAIAATERAAGLIAPQGVEVSTSVLQGQPAEVIARESASAELTVVGVKNKPGRGGIGRLAGKLLDHPEISLLCVQ